MNTTKFKTKVFLHTLYMLLQYVTCNLWDGLGKYDWSFSRKVTMQMCT